MVEGDYGVVEHKEAFWQAENIFHWASSLGLEIAHTVITYVANYTSSQRGERLAGHSSHTVLRKLGFEERERIFGRTMAGSCLDNFERIFTS